MVGLCPWIINSASWRLQETIRVTDECCFPKKTGKNQASKYHQKIIKKEFTSYCKKCLFCIRLLQIYITSKRSVCIKNYCFAQCFDKLIFEISQPCLSPFGKVAILGLDINQRTLNLKFSMAFFSDAWPNSRAASKLWPFCHCAAWTLSRSVLNDFWWPCLWLHIFFSIQHAK